MRQEDCIGLAVISTAGRDKNRICFITQVSDTNYVLVSDGRKRKTENPKRKKIKHIRFIAGIDEELLRLPREQLTNRRIRERIARITAAANGND